MSTAQTINGTLRRVPTWPVYLLGTLPFWWMCWQIYTGNLGVDPLKSLEHEVGKWGLKFLVAVLCVTPLRRYTGVSLLKFRRALGLLAFFYVALHLMVWLGLDIQFRWSEIWADILKRPYITIGMAGFVAMIPLAVTSGNWAIRRMGRNWHRLHRLTYLAAVLGAVHYLMLVKAWPPQPIVYLSIVLALLAVRAWWAARRYLPPLSPARG